MIINVLKVFAPSALAFFVGITLTKPLVHYLYKYKMWKKKARNEALGGGETPLFHKLHSEKETSVPRMGGVIIWSSTIITTFLFWSLIHLFPTVLVAHKLNFLSRSQVWLPLFTLVVGSLVGLVDDLLAIKGKGGYIAGGLPLKVRIGIILLLGFLGAAWYYAKLGVTQIFVPFYGDIELGMMFYPVFMITMLALFSGGVIDGIDGLAGGIMATIFAAYSGIAFFQSQIDIAAFCLTITGATLAFLWFNVPPAKFYMSETGIIGLTTTLTVVAFLTESAVVLPIIALPLFVSSGSVILQMLSKKFRGKKIFLIAPIHHHFEALGWPSHSVTMRYWIVGIICSIIGSVTILIGRQVL